MRIAKKYRMISRSADGLTLIELMIAMVIMAFGIIASMNLIIVAIAGNARSKQQSNSTALAQTVTERIMAVPANNTAILTITDCTNAVFNVNTAAGGAPLTAAGDVGNYNMQYNDCATNGRTATYDVRWNVQSLSGYSKLLTVSSRLRAYGRNGLVFAPVVTIRTIVGQGT
jgi:prepilin-type N-terminal cleavage/methylation domain-containing protein